ncbi:carbohydrate-binding protein [Acetivibrio cellulolyticus]|uniref:carbohydrate-binding protein n=1 Tax=Acetivibrio cellulolyticus TaxID=35830 RepID=UPI00047454CD|nr:carbohydrate-binding protein [Acetivibrio cellulolyticus]
MKRLNFRRVTALISASAFLVMSYTTESFALTETVQSYCTKKVSPVVSVNLGGAQDITVDGVNFKSQNAVKNLLTSVGGPSSEVIPSSAVKALSKIEAESLVENHGLVIESCPDTNGTENLAYIDNGDYAAYENVYFARGTRGFMARVSSDTEGGYIEFRLDSPSGEVIGKVKVERTGGWQVYQDVFCELEKSVEGLHRLYLGCVGERTGMYNINWFRFLKGPFDPIKAKSYDEASSDYYLYKQVHFGESDSLDKFKAHVLKGASGTIDVRLDSPAGDTIASITTDGTDAIYEDSVRGSVTGIHDLYISGSLVSKVDWFAFDSEQQSLGAVDQDLGTLLSSNLRGYSVNLNFSLDKNSLYEVYLYTAEYQKQNKQVFDLVANGATMDTIDMEKSDKDWAKSGPYLVKVLTDGKLSIECKAKSGIATVAGIEINKVTYSKAFNDVKIKDWFYIPVMELASQGVIFGKGTDQYKPGDHIIGEHAAYMLFGVMKRSIAENDSDFIPERYRKLSDIAPDYWAYHYMSAYYNYFYKEKMLRYDVNTKAAYSAKQYEESKKVRREEFAMAIIGTRRLDYNEDGKVFALDPELESSAKLNNYKKTDASKVTDSFRYFIELALENNLMKGDQYGNLSPKNPVTRGEAAAFIYNALKLDKNNFIKPQDDEVLAVPRITAKKRNVNVGILILPAPARDTINNIDVNDPNPDFSIMELLDRNINKPMDWVLVNPHPPVFNKSEFKDVMQYSSSEIKGIDNKSYSDFCNYFKDLRSVAKAQTDLEADMTGTGVVGDKENMKKSKFYKYWEVSINDDSLTPEKIAKDYDVLFQTSHGSITYPTDVQDKVKAFLNAGGQLWWENCRGLEIKAGDGFTDEVGFVSLNPGNNYKYPQVPVLDENGEMHPLFDNIYTIDREKTTRVYAPGLINKNSEISMLGDGEEWLNDDNRYLSGILPTDTVLLNIEDPQTGLKRPNIVTRTVKNENGPEGRIVITTSDIGCGISKFVNRGGGKAVEDYKFCYNLIGWMSKIGVSFDETTANSWDGSNAYAVEATVTNYGAKTQTYELKSACDAKLWDLTSTTDFSKYKEQYPWIKSIDAKGYPNKIVLKPNQTEVITYKFNIKTADIRYYEFTLKASEYGVLNPRDSVETTYRLNNLRVPKPVMSNVRNQNNNSTFDIVLNAPEEIDNDLRPETYELNLKFKRNGSYIDPESVFNGVVLDTSVNTPGLVVVSQNYVSDAKDVLYLKIKMDNVVFTDANQKIKLSVMLKNANTQGGMEVIGKTEVYDPISLQRLAFSNESVLRK